MTIGQTHTRRHRLYQKERFVNSNGTTKNSQGDLTYIMTPEVEVINLEQVP